MRSLDRRPVSVLLVSSLVLSALGSGCTVSPTAERSVLLGGWTPASLTRVQGWWDASAIAGKRDGDPITTWLDRSGLGRDLLSGGAGAPTYKVAIQNGLPVVRFDGTSNWMSRGWAQAQPVTICIVFRYRGTVTTYPQKDLVDNGNGPTGLMTLAPMGANGHLDIHGYNVVNGPPIGADTWYTATAVFNGATSSVEVNGGTPFPGNADTPAPGGIALGGRITNSEFAPVDIGEVFIVSGVLSDADRAQADRYLGAKWGLTTPPPPPGPAGFAGPDQTVALGSPVHFAATPAANLPYRFWTKMSGPGIVHVASEQFNSSFEDPTLADWTGPNPTPLAGGELQGAEGTWQTTQYAVPSTDHVRSGTYGWKARTSLDWQHSAKLLRWRFDDPAAFYSVWCYWPSNLTVNGHGSAGFTDYLNLFQWKERTSPWNPTWIVAVDGTPGTTTLDEFIVHDWYGTQPIVHTGVTVPKDQWFNLTAYMKEGFGTSGQIIVWLNNQIIFNQSGINTLGGPTNTTAHLMWGIGNYSNALVGQGGESLYFDDALVVPGQNDVTTTTATFSARGTYVLRLTASDGTRTATDDVTITVP